MSEQQKTPRQLIRAALLDAISADADWSQSHVKQRNDELERIGDELERALAARNAGAEVTEEMLQRAIAGFMGSFDKSFEDSMYNALKAALNPNQT